MGGTITASPKGALADVMTGASIGYARGSTDMDGQLRAQRAVVSRKNRYGRFAEHRQGDGLCDILRRMPL